MFSASRKWKGCFVGSGSEGMQQPEVCATIVELTGKAAADITVLYIGTATYDLPLPKRNQTIRFIEAGCKIVEVKSIDPAEATSQEDMRTFCESADVMIVSGGNTLFAIDKWHAIGLSPLLRAAAERGAVMTGGSAGAICWFDAGHSDSGDADTYKDRMLKDAADAAAAAASTGAAAAVGDESSSAPAAGQASKDWAYMRVPCLGLLPGLVCPHADRVQSNGVLRVVDFNAMMLRHSGERGLCIDHFAAMVVENGRYRVLSLPGRPGSVMYTGGDDTTATFSEAREGVPGMWVKDVVDGVVRTSLVPMEGGPLESVLRVADKIEPDPRLDACRGENPI